MSLRGGLIFFPDEPLDLLPGGHGVLLSVDPLDGLPLRQRGWELRDTLLVLRPQGTSFAFLFRQPPEGTVAENVLQHGCGGLHIDACRVGLTRPGTILDLTAWRRLEGRTDAPPINHTQTPVSQGRWPSNLVLVHHPECREAGTREVTQRPTVWEGGVMTQGSVALGLVASQGASPPQTRGPSVIETIRAWECHESCPVRAMDEQSGQLTTHPGTMTQDSVLGGYHGLSSRPAGLTLSQGDTGGASRFFPQFKDEAELQGWLRRLIGVE